MLKATKILREGEWSASDVVDEITLDYDRRHRRRLRFTGASGVDILLDLPAAVHIRDGDAMVLEGGGLVTVRAAAEALLEVQAADADALARLAWHLGNRHLAVQFLPGALRILDDHVIAAMIDGLGGTAIKIAAPFDPESGAYGHG